MNLKDKRNNSEATLKQKESKKKMTTVLVCMIVGVLLFFGLMVIEANITNQKEYVTVYKAKVDMPEATKITPENVNDLIREASVEVENVTADAITSVDEMNGAIAQRAIFANEDITHKNVSQDSKSSVDRLDEPIKVSFSVSNIVNAVAGEIREGDRVNIYALFKLNGGGGTGLLSDGSSGGSDEAYSISKVAENVYIQGAYDSAGGFITNTPTADANENNTSGVTSTMFVIDIPKEFETSFVVSQYTGIFIMTKVIDAPEDVQASYGIEQLYEGELTDVILNSLSDVTFLEKPSNSGNSNSGSNTDEEIDEYEKIINGLAGGTSGTATTGEDTPTETETGTDVGANTETDVDNGQTGDDVVEPIVTDAGDTSN